MFLDLITDLLPILGGGEEGGLGDLITGGLLDGLLEGLLGDSTGSFGSS
ncbi:hypothetical protein O4160_12285 [Rhodococcus sp. IEGM 1401]|jgi:hypothetical protein|uniref:Uncharacterized protein n=2 Tax=Rhodococcus TaxID=1827 RepID=A0ABU4AXQ9_9NOCA|nr:MULTISPECIES: hypothetical protein [Rhodococcus]MCZ4561613.1 hypothetical protein [Rhodococcus sp. IEGM 1401]MDI6628812.1 hypothetical protein [Rhodococcus sp. (in: high G+C Gram-positive bacteria)]MDI9921767.1 hypothetical protein [Rhodococcus sp. IEGM 1372]MDI9928182.1 hypothetical protein [Rhodococcus sp. IEGM 1341]MDV6231036.1 hypothetical protein [Rhodococcus cercidiphylli]